MTHKLKFIIPFIVIFLMLGLLWKELGSNPTDLPSALIGDDLPLFSLPSLQNPQQYLTQDILRGRVMLLNVWATWCEACEAEQSMLLEIKREGIPIVGLDYKDDRTAALQWLQEKGNPYSQVAMDELGDTAIDLGVYGTPETFVISPAGKIIYRHIGAIDAHTWNTILLPLIQKYSTQHA